MFGKKHTEQTKNLISAELSRHLLRIGIYDLNNNSIKKFKNNTELAKYFDISKVTLGKY